MDTRSVRPVLLPILLMVGCAAPRTFQNGRHTFQEDMTSLVEQYRDDVAEILGTDIGRLGVSVTPLPSGYMGCYINQGAPEELGFIGFSPMLEDLGEGPQIAVAVHEVAHAYAHVGVWRTLPHDVAEGLAQMVTCLVVPEHEPELKEVLLPDRLRWRRLANELGLDGMRAMAERLALQEEAPGPSKIRKVIETSFFDENGRVIESGEVFEDADGTLHGTVPPGAEGYNFLRRLSDDWDDAKEAEED